MVGGEANEVSLILLTGCGKLGDGRENENAETRAPSLVLTSYISEDSILTCEYELTAPQDATYLQINVEQYSNGESDCLFTGGGVYWGGQSTD